jgi:ligand-binding sensor domain-containing protein
MEASILTIIFMMMIVHDAHAADPIIKFPIGAVNGYQKNEDYLGFELRNGKKIQRKDWPDGRWPPIYTDTQGNIYIGDKVVNAITGEILKDGKNPNAFQLGKYYRLVVNNSSKSIAVYRGAYKCNIGLQSLKVGKYSSRENVMSLLREGVIYFVDSDGPLVAVVTNIGWDSRDTSYHVISFEKKTCRILSSVNLGNLDNGLELGWSPEGHWWIAGPEPNFLRSSDGKKWVRISLPDTISELMSAYVSDDHNIWLAATDGRLPLDDGPLLINSKDGGKTWTPVAWNSVLINEVPKYWLEGQVRVYGKEVRPDEMFEERK